MANAVMIYYKNKVRDWGVEMGDERPVANWVRCTNDVPSKKHGSLSECIPDDSKQQKRKEETRLRLCIIQCAMVVIYSSARNPNCWRIVQGKNERLSPL